MAITKVFAIHSQLGKTVGYAADENKTKLEETILYPTNPEKAEEILFESAINCGNVEQAFDEMTSTKERYHKTGGILGYHVIQSFKPHELSPSLAHQIGIEFAMRL